MTLHLSVVMTDQAALDRAVRRFMPTISAYLCAGWGLAVVMGWVLLDDIRIEYHRIVAEDRARRLLH